MLTNILNLAKKLFYKGYKDLNLEKVTSLCLKTFQSLCNFIYQACRDLKPCKKLFRHKNSQKDF
ncbi:hypothetical protein DMC01_08725 [Campylobacter troglodytis]|nr:hypothetical protein DMC01_08725 [Campylobacter troglodytis]